MDHARRMGAQALMVAGVALLLALALVAAPAAAASGPAGTGAVSGSVFFDANGDGLMAANGAEAGVAAATVQLLSSGPTLTTTTDANGAYAFTGLAAGSYTAVVQPPAGYVTTTSASRPVTVGSGAVTGIHFGLAYPISIWGAVCQDVNADGQCATPMMEPRIAGATVQVFDDVNRNGLIDLGEATLASTTTNTRGEYLIANLRPGGRIVLIRLPGGAESNTAPLTLESSEAGAATFLQNFAIGRATLQGVVFNDVNGNEFPDAGEKPLGSAVVQLLAAAGGQSASTTIVATATTGIDGRYLFSDLWAAAYQVRVSAPVPVGWLASSDATAMIPDLQANVTTTLDIGYFDPAAAPPMSVADWKREARQAGQWAYTATEQQQFVAAAQATSRVFSETIGLTDALLLGRPAGVPVEKWRAQKELAALWLNLASLRLRPDTAVKLGTLSSATTVRQARDEIEALLLYGAAASVQTAAEGAAQQTADVAPAASPAPMSLATDYGRALAIAQALNTAQGVGAGLTGASAVIDAVYAGAQVASSLKPGGDIVQVNVGSSLTLRKWSASYKSTTNTLLPQVRLRVKSFNEGGVLDVVQVFPDGRRITLGTLRSTVQNKDVNKLYLLNLSRVTTVAELVNTTIVLSVRDLDGRKPASVKVDSAEIIFRY